MRLICSIIRCLQNSFILVLFLYIPVCHFIRPVWAVPSGSDVSSFQKRTEIVKRYPDMILRDVKGVAGWFPERSSVTKKQYGAVAGFLLVYALLDRPISESMYDSRKNDFEKKLDQLTDYTEHPLTFGGIGLACGLLTGNAHLADAGFTIIEGTVFSEIIVGSLKRFFGRSRPIQTGNSHHFRPLRSGYSALPSGHTIHAFTLASILAEYYPKTRYIAYGTAGAIGLQRMYIGAHWLTDVLSAAVLGYWIGKKLARSHIQAYPVRYATGAKGMELRIPFK